jgi:site-specific recombinase XerD
MLTLWRRHLASCPDREQGRYPESKPHSRKRGCSCPIWCDGVVGGRRIRKSLDTCDLARAGRKLATLEEELQRPGSAPAAIVKSVGAAGELFLSQREVEPSSLKKYRRVMGRLSSFAGSKSISSVEGFTLADLDQYKLSRELCALSWQKELQLLRTFFAFCIDRDWTKANPAKKMKMPANPKPKPRAPYSQAEVIAILAATESFGRHSYERLRARAMVELLRFYGLRVSDVATLRKDRIKNNYIFLQALKNGVAIWLPLYPEVQAALERLPLPQGAGADCEWFFWTGQGARDGHIKTVVHTLKAVFKASGVEHAHAHRFRHTLATKILVEGGSIEDAANILGDSPEIIRKHYLKWSPEYQRRTVEIMARVHGSGTYRAHEENQPVSDSKKKGYLVLEEGVEPSYPVKDAGF